MNFRRLAVLSAFVALAGCTTATTYHPADFEHGQGYSDRRLADTRYRVAFNGNSATRRETVEDYLLLRAAEVARDAGYAWFEFDNRDTEARTTYHSDFAGRPGFGAFGGYWHSWRFDDPFDDETIRPSTRYEAYAEIVLLTPDQAKHEPRALRADDVIARLGPAAHTPPPQN